MTLCAQRLSSSQVVCPSVRALVLALALAPDLDLDPDLAGVRMMLCVPLGLGL